MRGVAIVLAALLAAPLVSGLALPLGLPPAFAPPLPEDISDAELVLLLVTKMGYEVETPRLVIPEGASVESLVLQLGARAGAPMRAEDAAMFRDLDPRLAAPTLAMLAAIDQAWTLRDQAFADLTQDEQRMLAALPPGDARREPLSAQIDRKPLFEAALLLLETMDAIVLPALDEANGVVPWPDQAIKDPVGVLRIGSNGNDMETLPRILQIDGRGDDTWRNNAGGTTILTDVDPRTLDFPIAMSVDMAGNDRYDCACLFVKGAGHLGIGILYDAKGDDTYFGGAYSVGAGLDGVGYLRDRAGTDSYSVGDYSIGSSDSLGIFREDAGNDLYLVDGESGGVGHQLGRPGLGLLWERGGSDQYSTIFNTNENYGWSRGDASGWLVDETDGADTYETATNPNAFQHGCNDCRWTASRYADKPYGRGLDNTGSLAELLSDDTAMSHEVSI